MAFRHYGGVCVRNCSEGEYSARVDRLVEKFSGKYGEGVAREFHKQEMSGQRGRREIIKNNPGNPFVFAGEQSRRKLVYLRAVIFEKSLEKKLS